MKKNTQKENSHDTKFTWFTTRATSTQLQRSFTIKQGDYKGGMKTLSQTQTPNTFNKLFVLKNNTREICSLFFLSRSTYRRTTLRKSLLLVLLLLLPNVAGLATVPTFQLSPQFGFTSTFSSNIPIVTLVWIYFYLFWILICPDYSFCLFLYLLSQGLRQSQNMRFHLHLSYEPPRLESNLEYHYI